MLSRRENLLIAPWQRRRYLDHRRKVSSALPAIDVKCPAPRDHVMHKRKKIQKEYERCKKIEYDNFILMKHLNRIMETSRVDNTWDTPPPEFLHRIAMFPVRRRPSPQRSPDVNTESPKTRKERCVGCTPKYFQHELQTLIPEARVPYDPPKTRLSRRRSSVLAQEEMNKEIDRLDKMEIYRKRQNSEHILSQRSLSCSSQRTSSYEQSPRYKTPSKSPRPQTRSTSPRHQTRSTSPGHQIRSTSTGHQTQSTSTGHQTQSTSTGHQTRSTSPGHQIRSTSPGHQIRSTSPGHQTRSTPPGHQIRSTSTGHQTQSTSTGHQTQSTSPRHQTRSKTSSSADIKESRLPSCTGQNRTKTLPPRQRKGRKSPDKGTDKIRLPAAKQTPTKSPGVSDLKLSTVQTFHTERESKKDKKARKKWARRSSVRQIELKKDALELVLIFPAQSKVTTTRSH